MGSMTKILDLSKLKNKENKELISETVRDRAKRTKIWDHMGYNEYKHW